MVLWDVAHGYRELPTLDSGQSAVFGVAFSPDGRRLSYLTDETGFRLYALHVKDVVTGAVKGACG